MSAGNELKCSECGKQFKRKAWLVKHLERLHSISEVKAFSGESNDPKVKSRQKQGQTKKGPAKTPAKSAKDLIKQKTKSMGPSLSFVSGE